MFTPTLGGQKLTNDILSQGQNELAEITAQAAPITKSSRRSLSGLSSEAEYSLQFAADPNIAELDGQLYRWTGSHWAHQSPKELTLHAFQWLRAHWGDKATTAMASSCVSALTLEAKPLPPAPQQTIIPMRDAWLVLDGNGNWHTQQPDPRIGIRHCLAVQGPSVHGPYTPQPVPADSLFAKFLAHSFPDPEVRELLAEYAGYTLTHDTILHTSLWLCGPGENGKSVMMDIISALHANAVPLQLEKLSGFNLQGLLGASLVTCDELPHKLDEQRYKTLVSGGQMSVNRKFLADLAYRPTAKVIACGNHVPAIRDQSHGFWRRLMIVHCDAVVDEKTKVVGLANLIINNELRVVLDWALAGWQRVVKRGMKFHVPQHCKLALQQAQSMTNNVLAWIVDQGVSLSATTLTAKDKLYADYENYCHANGTKPHEGNEFFKRLKTAFPAMQEHKKTVSRQGKSVRVRHVNLELHVYAQQAQPVQPAPVRTVSADDQDEGFDPFAWKKPQVLDKQEKFVNQ